MSLAARSASRAPRSRAACSTDPARSVIGLDQRELAPASAAARTVRTAPDACTLRASVRWARNGRRLGLETLARRARPAIARTRSASRGGTSPCHEAQHLGPAPVLHRVEPDFAGLARTASAAVTRSGHSRAAGTDPRNSSVTCHWSGRCGRPTPVGLQRPDARRQRGAQRLARPEREEQPVAALGPSAASGRSSPLMSRARPRSAINDGLPTHLRRGLPANRCRAARTAIPASRPCRPGEPHRADGLVGRAAVGPGNAAHRHGDVAAEPLQRTRGHLADDRLADRTVVRERARTHAEQRHLELVRVGDHTAAEPLRTAGAIRAGLGDPAAGAGFRRHQLPTAPRAAARPLRL